MVITPAIASVRRVEQVTVIDLQGEINNHYLDDFHITRLSDYLAILLDEASLLVEVSTRLESNSSED